MKNVLENKSWDTMSKQGSVKTYYLNGEVVAVITDPIGAMGTYLCYYRGHKVQLQINRSGINVETIMFNNFEFDMDTPYSAPTEKALYADFWDNAGESASTLFNFKLNDVISSKITDKEDVTKMKYEIVLPDYTAVLSVIQDIDQSPTVNDFEAKKSAMIEWCLNIKDVRDYTFETFENTITQYAGQLVTVGYHGFINFNFVNEHFALIKTNDYRYLFGNKNADEETDINFSIELAQIADVEINNDGMEAKFTLHLLNGDEIIISVEL